MPAYLVAELDVSDREKIEEYVANEQHLTAAFGSMAAAIASWATIYWAHHPAFIQPSPRTRPSPALDQLTGGQFSANARLSGRQGMILPTGSGPNPRPPK
jgi:hypothetical protein